MMSVSDIQTWHLGKLSRDGLDICIVGNYPELMAETIDGRDEVIFRLQSSITHDKAIQRLVVRIGKEHGLDVGIVHTDMLHTVLLLITTGQLMLLDVALHVVVGMGANHQTILRLAVHRLGIDIIMFLRVLHQPTLILELLEVLCSLFVNTWIILRGAYREVNLRLDDVIQTLLIVASLCASLF